MADFRDLTLVHYSAIRLEAIKSFDQPERLSPYGKPKGLWVSVESAQEDWRGWREWCESEQSALDRFEYAAFIHLTDGTKVKLISDANEINAFHTQFSRLNPECTDERSRCIDWKSVANSYSGVIISPYIWEMHPSMKPSWYYAWHCASGCIWDAKAIGFIEALTSFKKPARYSEEAAWRSAPASPHPLARFSDGHAR
jgi:hypothetical protein